jgi:hypothetical protein
MCVGRSIKTFPDGCQENIDYRILTEDQWLVPTTYEKCDVTISLTQATSSYTSMPE